MLLLADRKERGMHVVTVEHAHELLGIGAGAIVEGERELVTPVPATGHRGRIGEHRVDRFFFRLVGECFPLGRGHPCDGRMMDDRIRLGVMGAAM